jgi:transposase
MPKGQRLVKSNKPKPTRAQILSMYDQGHTTSEVCTALGASTAWARRVKQERRESGKTENSKTRRRMPEWLAYKDRIEEALTQQPDLSLSELKQHLGTTLHLGTLCRALQRLKLTFKKKS